MISADECFMPMTVGGGIKSLYDIENLFKVGADRVSINSATFHDPEFVKKSLDVKTFGEQSIIISVDYKKVNISKYGI